MEMNFFQSLAAIGMQGNMTMIIKQLEGDELLLLLHLSSNNVKDSVVKTIQPLKLRGSAEELDREFFANVTAPIRKVDAFLAEVEAQEKSLATARKKWETQKKDTKLPVEQQDAEVEKEREKDFEEAMQKVGELERDMKYGEAIAELPDVATYPKKEQQIARRRKELEQKEKLGAGLFG